MSLGLLKAPFGDKSLETRVCGLSVLLQIHGKDSRFNQPTLQFTRVETDPRLYSDLAN